MRKRFPFSPQGTELTHGFRNSPGQQGADHQRDEADHEEDHRGGGASLAGDLTKTPIHVCNEYARVHLDKTVI